MYTDNLSKHCNSRCSKILTYMLFYELKESDSNKFVSCLGILSFIENSTVTCLHVDSFQDTHS